MFNFVCWEGYVPLQPLQPLLLVDTRVEALFPQSRGTVEALLWYAVWPNSLSELPIYRV